MMRVSLLVCLLVLMLMVWVLLWLVFDVVVGGSDCCVRGMVSALV